MSFREEMLNYHCPRWDEFPDIDLYMDQVVNILEKNLSIFEGSYQGKIITSSMINNYVKQKVVKPPINKKYDKVHLAYLFVVCTLKRIMSIPDICSGIEMTLRKYDISEIYNIFCDELENAIKNAFLCKEDPGLSDDMPIEILLIKSVVGSIAKLEYAHYIINNK